jgi:hypothetical protein
MANWKIFLDNRPPQPVGGLKMGLVCHLLAARIFLPPEKNVRSHNGAMMRHCPCQVKLLPAQPRAWPPSY